MSEVIFRRPHTKNIGRPHALDVSRYTPIRSSNSLSELKKWIKWAKKYYPKTEKKMYIIDKINLFKSDPYWANRYNHGYENRYEVWEEKWTIKKYYQIHLIGKIPALEEKKMQKIMLLILWEWIHKMKKETKKFILFLILLVVDLVIPDPIPFIDEILIAIATIYYGVKIWH